MNENIPTPEEFAGAFEEINKNFPAMKINTVVCSYCNCSFTIDDENSKPCEHLVQMFQEWKNGA